MTRSPSDAAGVVVVHYGTGLTGRTTVSAAAQRLGITDAMYQRVLADLVTSGYLRQRPDGSYDADDSAGVLPQ